MPLTPEQQRAADQFRSALKSMERDGMLARNTFKSPDDMKAVGIAIATAQGEWEIVELLKAGEFDKDFAGLFGHY